MTFFTHNMKLQFKALGKQEFADDPKVVTIFKTPGEKLAFYMTEYREKEDCFFGYVKGTSVDSWGSIPRNNIEAIYKVDQEISGQDRTRTQLSKPTPISELVPAFKEPIMVARLNRLMEEQQKKNEQERDQDQGQEPEH
tara:strand:- start:2753 stop:3169 length:417 start_codon:yes stop_codon:yes gene_type:complete